MDDLTLALESRTPHVCTGFRSAGSESVLLAVPPVTCVWAVPEHVMWLAAALEHDGVWVNEGNTWPLDLNLFCLCFEQI